MHIDAGNAELCSYQKVKLSDTQCSSNVLSLSTDRNSCVMVVLRTISSWQAWD